MRHTIISGRKTLGVWTLGLWAMSLFTVSLFGWTSARCWADGTVAAAGQLNLTEQQALIGVQTDITSGMSCGFSLILTEQNEFTGAVYSCADRRGVSSATVYTLDQLRQGVVLYHDTGHNLDAVTLSAPDIDGAHGGPVVIRYIYNAITGEYRNFSLTVEPQGTKWLAYTGAQAGHQAFNQMFLAKKTIFGATVGIKQINVSWTQPQATLAAR